MPHNTQSTLSILVQLSQQWSDSRHCEVNSRHWTQWPQQLHKERSYTHSTQQQSIWFVISRCGNCRRSIEFLYYKHWVRRILQMFSTVSPLKRFHRLDPWLAGRWPTTGCFSFRGSAELAHARAVRRLTLQQPIKYFLAQTNLSGFFAASEKTQLKN